MYLVLSAILITYFIADVGLVFLVSDRGAVQTPGVISSFPNKLVLER
jgi:hypothetical protein